MGITLSDYLNEESIDQTDKLVVVDWYYKVQDPSGKKLLHYCKFCGDEVLFATENEERYRATGWYDHGLYPVVFDTLFPEKNSPAGFGYIAIAKGPADVH